MCITAVCLCVGSAQPQTPTKPERPTIRESLAKSGRSLEGTMTIPSGPAPTMAEILADADTLLIGTVGQSRSRLSSDELDIFTDYEIQNPVVLYQRNIASTPTPQLARPIVVTLEGGAVVIGGLTYTETALALPQLAEGMRCVFLLKHVGDTYRVAGRFYGIFSISDGRLAPLTPKQGFAPEYIDAPLAGG